MRTSSNTRLTRGLVAGAAALALLSLGGSARAQGSAAPAPSMAPSSATPAPAPASTATAPAPATSPAAPDNTPTPGSSTTSEPEIVFTGAAAAPAPETQGGAAASAPMADRPSEPELDEQKDLGNKQRFWRIAIGPRIGYVSNPGFDVFADNDVLPAWSFEGSRTLVAQGRLSLAAGLALDLGGRAGHARGQESGLFVGRLSVPLEGRYHVLPWLYGFARLAPGAAYLNARVQDASTTGALKKNGGVFTADLSAGMSVLLGPHKPGNKGPRFWVTPEFGYAWSTAMALDLAPEGRDDDPRPVGSTSLGELALRGPFFRVSAALTF